MSRRRTELPNKRRKMDILQEVAERNNQWNHRHLQKQDTEEISEMKNYEQTLE